MNTKNKYTYNKKNIKTINELFSNDNSYNSLFNALHYENKKKDFDDLRNDLITLSKGEEIDTEQLDAKIQEFVNTSTLANQLSNSSDIDAKLANKRLKKLVDIVDEFSTKIFKYNSDKGDYASTIVAANKSYLSTFNELSENKLEADELLKNNSKNAIDLNNAYENLLNSFRKVNKIEEVKSSAKTHYLKRAGLHRHNILNNIAMVGVFTLLGMISPIAGAPFANASAAAIGNFMLQQVLPSAIAATALTMGVTTLRSAFLNYRFNRVRNQLKQLVGKKEKNLENLFNDYRLVATKKRKVRRKNIKALGKDYGIKFGLFKNNTYKYLLEAKEIGTNEYNLSKKINKSFRKLEKLENKNAPNVLNLDKSKEIIESIELSRTNPLSAYINNVLNKETNSVVISNINVASKRQTTREKITNEKKNSKTDDIISKNIEEVIKDDSLIKENIQLKLHKRKVEINVQKNNMQESINTSKNRIAKDEADLNEYLEIISKTKDFVSTNIKKPSTSSRTYKKDGLTITATVHEKKQITKKSKR